MGLSPQLKIQSIISRLAHNVEVFESEVAAVNHGLNHVAEELGDGADFVAVIDEREGEVLGGKFGSEVGGLETDFVEIIFILHKNEVSVKSFDLIKSPSIEQESTVAEGVFEAISGEVGGLLSATGKSL